MNKFLKQLNERLDRDLVQNSYIAKSAPSQNEIGWLGHKKFQGQRDKVQIEFDPNDDKIQNAYIYHTHPSENPSPLSAMPSVQDLITAIEVTESGIRGVVIYSGEYYTVIAPTVRAANHNFRKYEIALQRGDIEDSIRSLTSSGFDIETGRLDEL